MRGMWSRPAVRIGLALLLAALVVGGALGVYQQVTASSYADPRAALRGQGATVRETVTAPAGEGYAWFLARLRAAGATIDLIQHRPNTPIFLGTQPATDGHVISVNGPVHGTVISAFEFADGPAATAYASHISGGDYHDPGAHQFIIVDYAAPPHFFQRDRLIVLYVGSDSHVIQFLTAILGPPFTEGHF